MIAARWAALLLATALVLAAFGMLGVKTPPSGLRLQATAAVTLLAPLFWPGLADTPWRSALRIVGWSAAALCAAAILIGLLSPASQTAAQAMRACAVLAPILLLSHAAAGGAEALLRRRALPADSARAAAGVGVAVVLAALGALPLWAGPLAEGLSDRDPGLIDAVIGLSPLTHLALASGSDLLRNEWLYRYSNLAPLSFTYPDLHRLAWVYLALCTAPTLALAAQIEGRARRANAGGLDRLRGQPAAEGEVPVKVVVAPEQALK